MNNNFSWWHAKCLCLLVKDNHYCSQTSTQEAYVANFFQEQAFCHTIHMLFPTSPLFSKTCHVHGVTVRGTQLSVFSLLLCNLFAIGALGRGIDMNAAINIPNALPLFNNNKKQQQQEQWKETSNVAQ